MKFKQTVDNALEYFQTIPSAAHKRHHHAIHLMRTSTMVCSFFNENFCPLPHAI
jgi:hypothetical protein